LVFQGCKIFVAGLVNIVSIKKMQMVMNTKIDNTIIAVE